MGDHVVLEKTKKPHHELNWKSIDSVPQFKDTNFIGLDEPKILSSPLNQFCLDDFESRPLCTGSCRRRRLHSAPRLFLI
ncbi:hypothetical protein J2W42_001129 [Rhizobium tibeticum]|nr:hypothetical protein [Rhizobium tibeticum]